MILRRHKHNWQQVSVELRPTTFPGNQTGIAVVMLDGDYCPGCSALRIPTKLDDVRWPVKRAGAGGGV